MNLCMTHFLQHFTESTASKSHQFIIDSASSQASSKYDKSKWRRSSMESRGTTVVE